MNNNKYLITTKCSNKYYLTSCVNESIRLSQNETLALRFSSSINAWDFLTKSIINCTKTYINGAISNIHYNILDDYLIHKEVTTITCNPMTNSEMSEIISRYALLAPLKNKLNALSINQLSINQLNQLQICLNEIN